MRKYQLSEYSPYRQVSKTGLTQLHLFIKRNIGLTL